MRERPGRICEVFISWSVAALAQSFNCLTKARDLLIRKAIEVWIIRRRKMRHHAVHANILEWLKRIRELTHFVVTHAETPHARINLEMNISDLLRFTRRAIKSLDHVQAINDGHEQFVEAKLLLSFPESAQTEYGLLDTSAS